MDCFLVKSKSIIDRLDGILKLLGFMLSVMVIQWSTIGHCMGCHVCNLFNQVNELFSRYPSELQL